MKVQVFAALKDYFDPSFELNDNASTVSEVKERLLRMNPDATSLLNLSRFAVNEEIVGEDFKINTHDLISILPPASGG
ncbi:MAG TPA: MoaD/ThiS family protein [Chitinophagaceae bacterium]|nr:MoaD/ThiS family protein [Chitinophagaceae bacterium]